MSDRIKSADEFVEVAKRVIPDEVQALIDKARRMKEEIERCERLGGHYFFGTGPSLILYPEAYFDPEWIWREIFAGRLPKEAAFSAAWRCSKCGLSVSQEEADRYHAEKPKTRAYWDSRLWC